MNNNLTILERAATSLDAWFGTHRILWLVVAAVFCVLTFSGYSHAKTPWMDEVLQVSIARLPTGAQVWTALRDGMIQIDPPVMHLMTHYLFRIFGEHIWLARLPSILGFCLACVSIAWLIWRHCPPIYAVAAFFLPYATVLRSRAMDARPYGLMVGFSALTLVCWDGIHGGRRQTAWRVAFTLSLAATFSTHFYSILLLLPLACGELLKWYLRKRIDWMTLACVSLALVPYLVWLPLYSRAGACT